MTLKIAALVLLTLAVSACKNTPNTAAPNASVKAAATHTAPINTVSSAYNFEDTNLRVKNTLETNAFKIFQTIDHAQGARSVDLILPPSTVYIFGNPKGGTPLMKADPRTGIAMPLKMHVYEDAGQVMMSYTNIQSVAQSYGLDTSVQPIPNIAAKLDTLAREITTRR